MNVHFLFLLSEIAKISWKCTRTEVDGSRCSAWAFTSLSTLGVWRYLDNVDEVNCPRFLFVYKVSEYTKTI